MAHKVESFARNGVTLKNVRADWSGVSEDRKTVAVSLWAHLFEPLNDYAYDVSAWTMSLHGRGGRATSRGSSTFIMPSTIATASFAWCSPQPKTRTSLSTKEPTTTLVRNS